MQKKNLQICFPLHVNLIFGDSCPSSFGINRLSMQLFCRSVACRDADNAAKSKPQAGIATSDEHVLRLRELRPLRLHPADNKHAAKT